MLEILQFLQYFSIGYKNMTIFETYGSLRPQNGGERGPNLDLGSQIDPNCMFSEMKNVLYVIQYFTI
jgi:hypothetical protein